MYTFPFLLLASSEIAKALAIPWSRNRRSCFLSPSGIGRAGFVNSRRRPAPADGPLPSTGCSRLRAAADLGTAYEWLAKERDGDAGGPVSSIRWVDIAELGKSAFGEPDDEAAAAAVAEEVTVEEEENKSRDEPPLRVPLYPLPAAYLPSGATQMLNNVEPRNMKMAQDLLADDEGGGMWDGRFCVVLRAADTGRVASVGTLMRVVDVEEHRAHYDKSLLRISVRCRAEGLVRIDGVENPDAWTAESRLRRSDEYLIAGVSEIWKKPGKRSSVDYSVFSGDDDIVADLARSICSDYEAVRAMYTGKEGVAARELPPFAVEAVQNIPELTVDDFASEVAFWDAAEAWQVLCNTVREARRVDIQSKVNEIMITAATEKGGPLQLPIHREDLPLEVQMRIKGLEEDAANDFVALGMDPCLDFQALISCRDHVGRLKHLLGMVSRERSRLEAKEQLKAVFAEGDGGSGNAEEVTGFE